MWIPQFSPRLHASIKHGGIIVAESARPCFSSFWFAPTHCSGARGRHVAVVQGVRCCVELSHNCAGEMIGCKQRCYMNAELTSPHCLRNAGILVPQWRH